MNEGLTKTEAVGRLVELAQQVELSQEFDFGVLNITVNELYEQMADNVLTQMYTVPEDHRETIMLGTLVKLLVENFMLTQKVKDESRV